MKIKITILNCAILSILTINMANADLIIGDSVSTKPQDITPTNTKIDNVVSTTQQIQPTINLEKVTPIIVNSKLEDNKVETTIKSLSGQNRTFVKNIGVPVNSVAIKGRGNNLPLFTVLQQIIPQNWQVDKAIDLNLNQQVSWVGGDQWYKILTRVAEDANLLIDINWDQKKVIIAKNIYSQSSMIKTNIVKDIKTTNDNKIKEVPKVETTQILKQPKYQNYGNNSQSQTWELKSDKTLKENLDEWAKKIGWVLSWDAPDYKIVNNVTLYGALDDPEGPIARVVNSYKDAKQPLRAKINRGNKVIRIESRNYEQESVVQKSAQELYNTSLSQ